MSESTVFVERFSAAGAAMVVGVDGAPDVVAEAARGLPDGPAQAEAIALRLARARVTLVERERGTGVRELLALAAERGRSSVDMLRAEPEIAREMEIGGWFDARPRRRLLRRFFAHVPLRVAGVAARLGGRAGPLVVQGAFWGGVRRAATDLEWRRLTRSSYVALCYHRLGGEMKPGHEALDISPALFARQMRLLRRLRFRPLTAAQLIAFHEGTLPTLPRRSVVITADDGFLDCVKPLLQHARSRPQLYVSSAEVGGRSWWLGDEPLADWEDLRQLVDAGVSVGSHAHRHVPLPDLDDAELSSELATSRNDLVAALPAAVPLLAYPHGQRDTRVVEAASAAGFRLAFTTDPGRNGAGTDPLQLRRVGAKAWDTPLSLFWKLLTGELLPPRWEARQVRRVAPSYRQPLSTLADRDD
jgi:peptidoglycan/xylan/chitin deacetylase (PgdA/CDA1 family)